MVKDKIDVKTRELAQDKEHVVKEVERVERAAQERDQRERDNIRKVNDACVREWEMRLKAKDFLRKVRRNTVRQLNLIVQDGSMVKNISREVSFDRANQGK